MVPGGPTAATLPDPGAPNAEGNDDKGDDKSKRYAQILRDVSDQIEGASPSEAYALLQSIPEKMKRINIAPYIAREQLPLLPSPSEVPTDELGADQ